MSKTFNPIQEGKIEGDLSKRILRGISETVRCLDDVRGRAQEVADLFLPPVEVQRSKLHELSYRLMLIDPKGSGKRGEETLWKKGYHDVFNTARRLKKENNWDGNEAALVRGLLFSGIGYYQHLIFTLQADYVLNIEGFVDFAMPITDYGLSKGKNTNGKQDEASWARSLASRCLLYLGDLARYMREIDPGWDLGLAQRFYLQAAWLDSKQGRPHNQLGTLAGTRNHSLDAVYHYMRSLCCAEAFDGAAVNLGKVFEKNASALELAPFGPNPMSPTLRAISRFLLVVDVWYWGKNAENIHVLCAEVVEAFQEIFQKVGNKERSEVRNWEAPFSYAELHDNLPLEAALEVFGILFMCWEKLLAAESSERIEVTACLLAMLDCILQQIVKRFQNAKLERHKRRRRRRCSGSSSSSDSGSSDPEMIGEMDSGDSPEVSSGDEQEELTNGHSNGQNGIDGLRKKWIEDDLLAILHILCCWLQSHVEALTGCPASAKAILNNIVTILNGLSRYVAGSTRYAWLRECKHPTFEETLLRGVPGLENSQVALDWSVRGRNLSGQEQAALRAHRLLQLGQRLPDIRFNKTTNRFLLEEPVENLPVVDATSAECRGQLMKNMGQLWLKAEVKELENRIRKAPGDFSPYLVVDSNALVDHIALVKQLVGSRQFIVVIPVVVLAQLDECKRNSGRARETIRWLESQFQHGNRHLRSQKEQERLSLGVIKYPKKKDKEAWNFFQMMECCNYLSKQSELRCRKSGKVTFLTGVKDSAINDTRGATPSSSDFSPSGLARTFGIALEDIEAFHSKWKLSSKSHG